MMTIDWTLVARLLYLLGVVLFGILRMTDPEVTA